MDVEIAMTAWTNIPARLEYFEKTLLSVSEGLSMSQAARASTFVCSEHLEQPERSAFEALCTKYGFAIYYHPEPAEIGANHNFLLSQCSAEFVLFIEDDCPMNRPLDVSIDAAFLRDNPDFVMLRYVTGHSIVGKELGDGIFEIEQRSPYLYSNQPHLRHRERFASLGPFTVGAAWGGQELDMGTAVKHSQYRVACRVPPVFGHEGRFASEQSRWPKGETP